MRPYFRLVPVHQVNDEWLPMDVDGQILFHGHLQNQLEEMEPFKTYTCRISACFLVAGIFHFMYHVQDHSIHWCEDVMTIHVENAQ